MYKTSLNLKNFKKHKVFSDFSDTSIYPKEQQAQYWWNVWTYIDRLEGMMTEIDFEHLNQGPELFKMWKDKWPFDLTPEIGGAPAHATLPTQLDGFSYVGEQFNFYGIKQHRVDIPKDWFDLQVVYITMLSMYSQLLNVDEDIKAFTLPLFKYNPKKFKRVQIKVVSAIVNVSDFVIATPDVFKETMEMGEWRLKESNKQIGAWQEGYQINEDGTREEI
tara:strand:- start:657 stop:1313 length:657 start_codon:yes stop_codon:yes gene_type:complete